MKRLHPTIALLLFLTAAYGAGFVGALGTQKGLDRLYPGLAKPAWNPPGWAFGPVWTALYALMAVAAWRVWRGEGPGRGPGLGLWGAGLVLNALWPWLFFAGGWLGLAAAECALLALSILATILFFRRSDRPAAWLLTPYLAWTLFATLLNVAIWRMNAR